MEYLPIVFLTSFVVVLFATPALIKVAILKRIIDLPTEDRKIHRKAVPAIGGIMIFAGTLFSVFLWFPIDNLHEWDNIQLHVSDFKHLYATALLLFFVGIKDDIVGTAPMKKLAAHVICAFILVVMGNIRLTGLHGLFGIYDIPYWASLLLSAFTYIVVVNAFNLIDGIDGLAGGVGFICCAAFATWFCLEGDLPMATLSLALAGALIGFLVFNFSPAKLFMGDSGSLFIGLVICVLAIKTVENNNFEASVVPKEFCKPVFVLAVLVYPLVDTLRIFVYRTVRGVSPFSADRNHLHHNLLDLGLSHRKIVFLIYGFNILIISLALLLSGINSTLSFLIVGGAAFALSLVPIFLKRAKLRRESAIQEQEDLATIATLQVVKEEVEEEYREVMVK